MYIENLCRVSVETMNDQINVYYVTMGAAPYIKAALGDSEKTSVTFNGLDSPFWQPSSKEKEKARLTWKWIFKANIIAIDFAPCDNHVWETDQSGSSVGWITPRNLL